MQNFTTETGQVLSYTLTSSKKNIKRYRKISLGVVKYERFVAGLVPYHALLIRGRKYCVHVSIRNHRITIGYKKQQA